MTPEPLALEILDELRAIRALLAQLVERQAIAPPPTLRARDRKRWRRLEPVLRAVFGDAEFTVAELREIAETRSVQGSDLRLAINGISAIALGRLFERAARCALMRKAGAGREGSRWLTLADPRFKDERGRL